MAGLTTFGCYQLVIEYAETSQTVDQGARGLVVVATSGGERPYNVNVRQYMDRDADARLVIYVTDVRGKDVGDQSVEVEVTFVGDSFGVDAQCQGSPLTKSAFVDLSDGAQGAILADAGGSTASAINYGGEFSEEFATRMKTRTYPVLGATVSSLADGTYRSSGDDEAVIECSIKRDQVWTSVSNVALGTTNTLMVPQVNFTAQTVKGQDQALWSDVSIARDSGMTLRESYPPVSSNDSNWRYVMASYETGGGLRYTDQPVLIFSNRETADVRAIFLVLVGTLLGVVASLIVMGLSEAVDHFVDDDDDD